MKDDKDLKQNPDKNEESFAYHEGIGDPDREWQKEMKIDGEAPSKSSDQIVDTEVDKEPVNPHFDDTQTTYGDHPKYENPKAPEEEDERKVNDEDLPIGDEENTDHVVEPHERFIKEDDPLTAEKSYDLDPRLTNIDKF